MTLLNAFSKLDATKKFAFEFLHMFLHAFLLNVIARLVTWRRRLASDEQLMSDSSQHDGLGTAHLTRVVAAVLVRHS